MKLSQWAKDKGLTYKGAHNLFKRKQIPGAYQLESGTIIIDEQKKLPEITRKCSSLLPSK